QLRNVILYLLWVKKGLTYNIFCNFCQTCSPFLYSNRLLLFHIYCIRILLYFWDSLILWIIIGRANWSICKRKIRLPHSFIYIFCFLFPVLVLSQHVVTHFVQHCFFA